jgi:hypothetical protein
MTEFWNRRLRPLMGGDLPATVSTNQRCVGQALAKGEQVVIIVTVKQRAASNAGEHHGKIRVVFAVDRNIQCFAHFLLGGKRLADCPAQHVARLKWFSQGQRAVAIGCQYGDAGFPRMADGDDVMQWKCLTSLGR